jgi:uncharacterized membrane protein YkoI
MTNMLIRSTVATGLLLAATSLAFAQGTSTQNSSNEGHGTITGGQATYSERLGSVPQGDVKPFESASVSLSQAVRQLQQERHGVRPIETRFEMWQGKPAYLIRYWTDGKVWEQRVDANSGQALGQERTIPEKQLSSQTRTALRDLQSGKKTDLLSAIDKAEHNGTKVIAARVAPGANDMPMYDLELVKNGTIHTAMVNPHNARGG